eukprot:4750285-Pleurochrysis_carterae.AAC.1
MQEAAAWLKRSNEHAVRPAPATVDMGSLNAGQSYAYRSILEHHADWKAEASHALHAAVNRTGSWVRKDFSHPCSEAVFWRVTTSSDGSNWCCS